MVRKYPPQGLWGRARWPWWGLCWVAQGSWGPGDSQPPHSTLHLAISSLCTDFSALLATYSLLAGLGFGLM